MADDETEARHGRGKRLPVPPVCSARGCSSAASAEVVAPIPKFIGTIRTFTGSSDDIPGEFWNQLNPPALRRQPHRGPFNDPLILLRAEGSLESVTRRSVESTDTFNQTIKSFEVEVEDERKKTATAELQRVRAKVNFKIPAQGDSPSKWRSRKNPVRLGSQDSLAVKG